MNGDKDYHMGTVMNGWHDRQQGAEQKFAPWQVF